MEENAERGWNILYSPCLGVRLDRMEQRRIAAHYTMCISSLSLNTQRTSSFVLPCSALVPASTSHCPSDNPLLLRVLPACQKGGWRSWWGYPVKDFTQSSCLLVFIPHHCPLSLPACILTQWRRLPIVILTLPLSRSLPWAHFSAVSPACLAPSSTYFFHVVFSRLGSFDAVCISNCVSAKAVSSYGCRDGCAGSWRRVVWFGRGHRVILTTTSCCLSASPGCLALCLHVLRTHETVQYRASLWAGLCVSVCVCVL